MNFIRAKENILRIPTLRILTIILTVVGTSLFLAIARLFKVSYVFAFFSFVGGILILLQIEIYSRIQHKQELMSRRTQELMSRQIRATQELMSRQAEVYLESLEELRVNLIREIKQSEGKSVKENN